ERYLAVFPDEQVHVVRFRDWVADPRATYLAILGFLGLADDGRTDFPPINQGMTYRSRTIARLVVSPPTAARRAARWLRGQTGPVGRLLYRAAWKGVGLLSAPGYTTQVDPELREQIRRYYAEDNRLLDERLRRR